MAKIKAGSDRAFASLWREKRSPSTFRGNRFTKHGKDREPVIATCCRRTTRGCARIGHCLSVRMTPGLARPLTW
ncbi:hypothetical protein [Corynebacterium sp. CNJ-954]|uniref:hypothetical protein n=1 Tax=Corynebacterium sp. CNJ-954 TaxID=1904962 RepID=UPI00350EB55B